MDPVSQGSANPIYADLEIRILARERPGYPVEISVPGEQEFPRGYLRPDFLPWVPSASPGDDGRRLFDWLLADERLRRAWAEARGRHPQRRVRLRLDPTAPELHTLPWELLREADDGAASQDLAAGVATPFSRYLAGRQFRARPVAKRPIKVLAAIAAPANLAEFGLAPIEPEAEWSLLQEATADLEIELVTLPQPCTLPAIEAGLKEGCHILHLVGHGKYSDRKDQAQLYLADDHNQVALVGETDFAAMLGRQWSEAQARQDDGLRLVFLASCQTAKTSSADAFRGFGPALIQQGVPAVVAMQDLILVKTARVFSQIFYRQLLAHGLVDLAGNEARAALLTAKLPGSSIPVLYSRLRDNRLFVQPGNIINLPPAPQIEAEEAIPDNPYRGLFAFRPEDVEFFFGRETFTQRLLQATASRRLVAVLGASGSGKSSVVFAGLVPALLNQPHEQWLFTTFRPQDDPFLGLANALVPLLEPDLSKIKQVGEASDLADRLRAGQTPLANYLYTIRRSYPDQRLLIIADQFEELYTLCRDPHIRRQFLDLLLATLDTAHDTWLHLVLTLRADFLGRASLYRPLADALQDTTELLGPMTRDEMTGAIVDPAKTQEVAFEARLVDRLLDDVGEEEGSLPLLEFALTELWGGQQGRTLTHVAYDEIGGVKGALSRHADKVYQRLSPEEQAQARRVFVQLVNPGEGTEDTRRVARQTDLAADWSLVARLAGERLVVTNQVQIELEGGEIPTRQNTVEVVHEALIRNWGQLRLWMDEDRDFRRWQENLRVMLRSWQKSEGDEAALLRGTLLAVAEEQLAARAEELSGAEKAFIAASIKRHVEEEAEEEARHQRELEQAQVLAQAERKRAEEQAQAATKLRRRAYVLAVVGAIAFILTIVAAVFGIQATRNAAAADVEREAAVTAQAQAEVARATAEAARQEIAQQNEATEAELAFSQTTAADRGKRVSRLVTLIELDKGSVVRKLFWGLPTEAESVALFKVENEGLVRVIKELYVTLADVNRTGYTDPLLAAMGEFLADYQETSDEAKELKAEIDQWRQAREYVRKASQASDEETKNGFYAQALSHYQAAININGDNPATGYERADLRADLKQYDQALADLERVMGLVENNPSFAGNWVVVEGGSEFATTEQVRQAIRRLIYWVKPEMASLFERSRASYPNLAPAGLTSTSLITDAKGVKMVLVEGGEGEVFTMGSSDDGPVHKVYLDDFYIDQYEVTNAQYKACEDDDVCTPPWSTSSAKREDYYGNPKYDDYPVISVDWHQARTYCEWRKARLPTEAEWEKAARGTDGRTYPWGEAIDDHLANYASVDTMPVGKYSAGVSPYGVYNMAGNVWEWVQSKYMDYPYRDDDGREIFDSTKARVFRGGSWENNANLARASSRLSNDPSSQHDDIGFRCARLNSSDQG